MRIFDTGKYLCCISFLFTTFISCNGDKTDGPTDGEEDTYADIPVEADVQVEADVEIHVDTAQDVETEETGYLTVCPPGTYVRIEPPNPVPVLSMEKDPTDSCRCLVNCLIIEILSDSRPCPEGKVPYDADGDTVPDSYVDPGTGRLHTLCEIPQAGSIISDCSKSCDDPTVTFSNDPSMDGYWYDPSQDLNGDTVPDPTINFIGVEPEGGSDISIECCL